MKKSTIKNLVKFGKIKLVESSLEISESYLQKSKNCFNSGIILLENSLYENSISMFYYSMYNCLLSLLFKIGIKSENHDFFIFLLNELFFRKDLFEEISNAKKERINKQYYIDSNTKEFYNDALILRKISENFILEIKLILNDLNSEQIKLLREKFNELI